MDNSNGQEFKGVSQDEIRSLQLAMRDIFVNHPHEDVKRILWELYKGWVYNSADYVSSEEITSMLLFYERILEFMGDVHSYCQILNRTVLK